MKSFRTLLCAHCTVVTLRLHCLMEKVWFPGFSRFCISCLFDNLVSAKKKLLFWKNVVENVLNFSGIPKSVQSKMSASSKIHKGYVFVIFAFLTEIRDSLSFTLIYCLLALSYQLQ